MQNTFRFLKWSGKKAITLFVLTVIIAATTVSFTVAYLVTRTRDYPNRFEPAEILVSSWTYNDVVNAGNAPVFVRASVVSAWVSNEDKRTVWSTTPVENIDYTLSVKSGWFKGSDGFYYHTNPINAAQSVDFVTATQNTTKDGYTLRILVMYTAIQTTPSTAVESAWAAVKVNEYGKLIAK